MPRFGVTSRAAGFRRVNVATRWLAAGAAILAGVFGFAAAGETASAKASTAPAAPSPIGDATATAPPVGPAVDPGLQRDQGFQTPDTLPQRSYREPVASSGGS